MRKSLSPNPSPARSENLFFPYAALRLPGFTLFLGAKWERAVDSETRGELSWPLRLQVQLRGRRPSCEFYQAPKKRRAVGILASVAVLARLRDQADFLVHKSCAPWHALSAPAGARSVPAPLLPAPPANQRRDLGAAPREPAPPPRSTAGFRTKDRGGGGGAPLCLLSPRGLCPSNSRFLKEPRPVRLAVPDYFASILSFLGTSPESLLVP